MLSGLLGQDDIDAMREFAVRLQLEPESLPEHQDELGQMKRFADSLFRWEPLITLDGFEIQNEFCLPPDG